MPSAQFCSRGSNQWPERADFMSDVATLPKLTGLTDEDRLAVEMLYRAFSEKFMDDMETGRLGRSGGRRVSPENVVHPLQA